MEPVSWTLNRMCVVWGGGTHLLSGSSLGGTALAGGKTRLLPARTARRAWPQ